MFKKYERVPIQEPEMYDFVFRSALNNIHARNGKINARDGRIDDLELISDRVGRSLDRFFDASGIDEERRRVISAKALMDAEVYYPVHRETNPGLPVLKQPQTGEFYD